MDDVDDADADADADADVDNTDTGHLQIYRRPVLHNGRLIILMKHMVKGKFLLKNCDNNEPHPPSPHASNHPSIYPSIIKFDTKTFFNPSHRTYAFIFA